jgi:PKHD-type hydroxylase
MKKKKIKDPEFINSVWSFESDNLETWAYYDSVFSTEECKKIIEIGNKKGLIKGTINSGLVKNIRDSKISWLYPSDDMQWVFRRLTDVVSNLNERFFKFKLYGFIEGLQFTHYKEPGGKYKKHIDRGINLSIRKLSLSIQLSDPKSYEGGDLLLHDSDKPVAVPKEQGKLILFPSYVLHEVTPVTKGERYSLVAWITGAQFK